MCQDLPYPKSFQALNHDYTRLPFSFLIDIQGCLIQKLDFPFPQDSSIWLVLFDWGNLKHFGPKRPRQFQIWLQLYPLTETSHESSLIQKNLSRQFTFVATIHQVSVPFQLGFLNKKKWKNGKRIMIFPSCIWDI